jgi:hypothetical protein
MFRRGFYLRPQDLQNPTKDTWKAVEVNPSETARAIYQYIRRLTADDLMSCWLVVEGETCFHCCCVVTAQRYVDYLWDPWFSPVSRIHVVKHEQFGPAVGLCVLCINRACCKMVDLMKLWLGFRRLQRLLRYVYT